MILFPNCKINIGLNIVARRPDGYHDIETIMVPAQWHDILEIVPAAGDHDTLTTTGRPVDCPPEKNLVMKAVRALREVVEFPAVDIFLEKIIPDGAGLGGGSADATFTLIGLNEVFGLGLSDDALAAVAARIGADCPFFIYNRPMLATGIGTTFAPAELDLKGYRMAIVKAPVGVSTAEAYSAVHPQMPERCLADDVTLPVEQWQGRVKNDFEPSVFGRLPRLPLIKEALQGMGAVYTAMSGSGSAMFGLFDASAHEADKLSEQLREQFPDCAIFVESDGE